MITQRPEPIFSVTKANENLYILKPQIGVFADFSVQILKVGANVILFGFHPEIAFTDLLAAMTNIATPSQIEALIIPEINQSIVSSLVLLDQYGMKTTIVINSHAFDKTLTNYKNISLFNIADEPRGLDLKNGDRLEFWHTPFITAPESFMAFYPELGLLLANHVFDYLDDTDEYDCYEKVISHQSAIVPSIDFLRPILRRISNSQIKICVTRSGKHYDHERIALLTDHLLKSSFYNVPAADGSLSRKSSLGYLDHANQIIGKLRNFHADNEIKQVFSGSAIAFDEETMTIIDRGFNDHRLWHQLFDIIYARKGVSWLAILEPAVNKIEAQHKIEKPAIYKSAAMAIERKVVELDAKRVELGDELSQLRSELTATVDKLLKDPLTGNYNQLFLEEHLSSRIAAFSKEGIAKTDIFLLFISLDNITQINFRFGKEIGDETIVNLAFILKQLAQAKDLLVKHNGPGFILMTEASNDKEVRDLIAKIQAEVGRADIFVEPTSVSIALVSLDELAAVGSAKATAAAMISTGEQRIRQAVQLGANALVDGSTAISTSENMRILLVDDDDILAKLLTAFFNKDNFEVVIKKDGQAALEIALKERFVAYIVAKNLPKIDGFSLKNRLNEATQTKSTFFILTTYNKTPETIMRANRLGIDAVQEKPLIFEEILGLIQRNQRSCQS